MATTPSSGSQTPPDIGSLRVVSHTGLVYWWPVWVVGFVLYTFTLLGGDRMAVVPPGTRASNLSPESAELNWKGAATHSLERATAAVEGKEAFPVRMASNRYLGLVFLVVLLIVVLGTNVVLRGLWSLVALLLIVLLTVVFITLGVWEPIIDLIGSLETYISASSYLFVSLVLFFFWMVTVFGFDQRRFMIFSPGQVVFHREIGDQSQVFDTAQIRVEKRRSDILRHFILGLGSGDLLVTVATGSGEQHFELPNVLFVDATINRIAEVTRIRPVTPER